MIKIEIDAATGAEARLELLKLLGIAEGKDIFFEQTEKPVEEPKTKRRTKAEIEAEKATLASNTGSEEPPASNENVAETTNYPSLQDLQRVCAILVRAGYKQQGIDVIKEIGGSDTSKDVPEDKRQACIDAMTKIAEENKISL